MEDGTIDLGWGWVVESGLKANEVSRRWLAALKEQWVKNADYGQWPVIALK